MKRGKLLALLVALVLLVLMPTTAFAATHENVDTWEKLQAAFADTDADVTIILTGDITALSDLEAKLGQTFVINGQAYTLKDVSLYGAGSVEINAALSNENNDDALKAGGQVQVTVNGDVTSDYDGISANGEAGVTVNGNITVEEDGIEARESSNVTVNGNIAGESDGVRAFDESTVNVTGDVTGKEDQGIEAEGTAEVTVSGNVTGSVEASGESTVHVTGDVTGTSGDPDEVDMTDPTDYSDGSTGVYAEGSAQVTVDGNVTGGDAFGTYGYAGDGVEARDESNVTVGGNVTGGNVTADPSVEAAQPSPAPSAAPSADAEEYYYNSIAGDGVVMDATANVTVGGDVTGGATNGDHGQAGEGVVILSLNKNYVSGDGQGPDNVQEEAQPGKLVVYGTVSGGNALADNGQDGAGIYWDDYYDGYGGPISGAPDDFHLPTEIPENIPVGLVVTVIGDIFENYYYSYGFTFEQYDSAFSAFEKDVLLPLINAATGGQADNLDDALDAVENLDAEAAAALNLQLVNAYNEHLDNVASKQIGDNMVLPEVTVWQVKSGGEQAPLFDSSFTDEMTDLLGADTNYIVRVADCENGQLIADKATAKAGETVTLIPKANDGYVLDQVLVNGVALEAVDGVYSFIMPEGGGIEVSAIFVAEAPAEAPTNTAGSPKTGDGFQAALLLGLMAVSAAAILVVRRKAQAK
ncbi:LPXTG cell wall anchor domain-containing protein [Christensenellaceae bacterium NSJ-44]|uniref:LPXTG cell wall anchor domain-containing protein n=1 Tax=Luoshenia tenuis TaxID=2763654 RepID=A0A926D0V8_9FIRM|nr:pectate lyase-like adhesive domain-containing protein [Luoshenia tenuis]MBC8529183.1 LPXTG cell wall anchor domain-containing protein [Luoshenia tenuis]